MKHYPALDWLRLALALLVVVAHWVGKQGLNIVQAQIWVSFGMMVPCFLAISGFVVSGSLERSGNVGEFWKRRALRILPGLLTSFALVALLFGIRAVGPTVFHWLSGGLVLPTAPVQNAAVWSLAWEELAYAFLCVLSICKFTRMPWLPVALMPVASLPMLFIDPTPGTLANIAPLAIAFLVGLTFFNYKAFVDQLPKWSIIVPFVLMLICRLQSMDNPWGHTYLVRVGLAVSMPALVLLAGIKLNAPKLKQDWSYGAYIYHTPLLHAGLLWLLPVICWASYCFIEKPALSLKDRKVFGGRRNFLTRVKLDAPQVSIIPVLIDNDAN